MKYQKLLSTNIKNLRQRNNLTQEEFAEKIGLSLNGVSNIERNRYQPTAATIDKICEVFEITPQELLVVNSKNNVEMIRNITAALSAFPPKKLKQIYEIICILQR